MTDAKTTLPAKQFICFKLQVVGTPAQVPVLAAMLDDAKTAEMALAALEQIPGDASLAVLRAGLAKYQGKPLVGVINSLANRKDAGSVAALGKLADGTDAEVAAAALWSLGRIGGPEARRHPRRQSGESRRPHPAMPRRCLSPLGGPCS